MNNYIRKVMYVNENVFYNEKICITFMNLIQREDWDIYINDKVLFDHNLVIKGKAIPSNLCYDMPLLATQIKKNFQKKGRFWYKD